MFVYQLILSHYVIQTVPNIEQGMLFISVLSAFFVLDIASLVKGTENTEKEAETLPQSLYGSLLVKQLSLVATQRDGK